MVTLVLIALIIYFLNKKYMYVIDAVFDGETPEGITLKTGFIAPVKTFIELKDGFSKKIKLYNYKISVKKIENGFDILLNSKKIYSIYSDSYYTDSHKLPTGRIYI